ncbi:MAG TPA: DNA polymerase III subunit gamma/tau [Cytophagaceae bacterium]|jgi:DNA polymerase-3 subunit gamma/tau
MENFVVSARKYRPATFDSVVGQSHITTTLKNAIKNNHLAQSFLFCGPRGVGKTTNARILAKTINCENITADIEACNTCDSCRSFNENSSFNIHELDAASNNSVDDIRNLVEQVRYPPQGTSKYKIYIIDEVHMLSNAAFNAFLKTLEEPPSYAIFILATTEKHKIIPTILSRCQIFDFNRIQVKDISSHLASIAGKENIEAEPQALHLIAQKADGALRDALSIFDLIVTFSAGNTVTYKTTIENLHILDYDYYFKITDALHKQSTAEVLITFDEILKQGFDGHNFIAGLSEHFRNLMVCKDPITIKLLEVSEDVQKKYLDQSSKVSLSFLMTALNISNLCDVHYKAGKNQRLHVELALMKMAWINSLVQPQAITSEAIAEEKKKPDLLEIKPQAAEPLQVAEKKTPDLTESKVEKGEVTVEPIKVEASKSEFRQTISLKSLKSLKEEISQEKNIVEQASKNVTTESFSNKSANVFTFEALKEYWQTYAKKVKEEKRMNQHVILDREIELIDGTKILIKLENHIQQDQLNEFKSDLLDYLRSNLKNYSISIEAMIEIDDSKKKLYTPKEKFEYLAEKNPLLYQLKNKLGLDTDF